MQFRLRKLPVDELDEAQLGLYRELTGGPRAQGPQSFRLTDDAGRLEGPFNAMLLSPVLGGALQEVGSRVRYSSGFSDRARELAILAVGYAWDSSFEIYAHERVARAAGLTDAELAGYYAALALQLRVFRVPLPGEGAPAPDEQAG